MWFRSMARGVCLVLLTAGSNAQQQGAAAASPALDVVEDWSSASSLDAAFAATWLVSTRVMDRDGSVREEFTLREEYLFRWPDCYIVRARITAPQEAAAREPLSVRFDYDESIDASGARVRNAPGAGDYRELATDTSLAQAVQTQAVNAPHLLGLWMHSTEHVPKAEQLSDGRVLCTVPELGLQFRLVRTDVQGSASDWAVDSIEVVKSGGELVAGWRYEDFWIAAGFHTATGRTRTPYSPRTLASGGGPPSTLASIEIVTSPPDAAFVLNLAGSATTDPQTGEIRDGSGSVIGHDVHRSSRRSWGRWALWGSAVVAISVLISGALYIRYARRA